MDAIEERKVLVKSRKIAIPPGVDVGEWFFTDGQRGFPAEQPGKHKAGSIATLLNQYLDSRRMAVQARQLSQASYASDKYRLAAFIKYCERKKATDLVDAISPTNLDNYRSYLLSQLSRGRAAAVSVKHSLRTVKAALLWAYDKEKLDALPRVLNKYAEISLPAPRPRFFTVQEVQTLYAAANDRMRLYILLALNCGYTQADIATLEHGHIDWQTGMVSRQRHKTGQPQEHKLWPITLDMLKQHATQAGQRDPDLALLGAEGNPLVSEKIKDDGTPSKVDAIGLAFGRLLVKCKVNDGRGFGIFRKTGADAIAKRFQATPHLVDLYLAHSPRGMRAHYAGQHYDDLHKATDWLASLFGFDGHQAANASAGGSP